MADGRGSHPAPVFASYASLGSRVRHPQIISVVSWLSRTDQEFSLRVVDMFTPGYSSRTYN